MTLNSQNTPKKFTHKFLNDYFPPIRQVNTDAGRYYEINEYTRYPSVTTFLSSLSKDGIDKWKQRVGEEEAARISRMAAARGTNFHLACESYLKNEPVENSIFANVMEHSMFYTAKRHLNRIDDVFLIETQMYSDHLRLAGTVDCVGRFDGKKTVIDFKTSARPKTKEYIKNYFLQATIYAIMVEEHTGIAVPNLAIIIAVAGEPTQVFQEKRDNYTKELLQLRKAYKDTL